MTPHVPRCLQLASDGQVGAFRYPRCLRMTCRDKVGPPIGPRYLRVASDGKVGASRYSCCM